MHFEPFRSGHLRYLRPQPAQAGHHVALLRSGQAHQLEDFPSLSAWHGNRCLGVAGLIPVHPRRAMAWAILSEDLGPYMLSVTRKIQRVVKASGYARVEVHVTDGHDEGHKFARLLGARLETPEGMEGHGMNGEREYMYSIVRA